MIAIRRLQDNSETGFLDAKEVCRRNGYGSTGDSAEFGAAPYLFSPPRFSNTCRA